METNQQSSSPQPTVPEIAPTYVVTPPAPAHTAHTPKLLLIVQIFVILQLFFGIISSVLSILAAGAVATIATIGADGNLASKAASWGIIGLAWLVILVLASPLVVIAIIQMTKHRWAYWCVVGFQSLLLATSLYAAVVELSLLAKGDPGSTGNMFIVLLQIIALYALLRPSSRAYQRR